MGTATSPSTRHSDRLFGGVDDVDAAVAIDVDGHPPDLVDVVAAVVEASIGRTARLEGPVREGGVGELADGLGVEGRRTSRPWPVERDPKLAVLLKDEVGPTIAADVGE